ncbi:MAG: stage II sporulation protein R [Clostridia bacterium]|nr:stage II sporulation protein R [Clostridia bacterium]
MSIRKNIETGILFGLICTIILSVANFDAACADIKSGVLRLHIIANSDSEEDQELKLKVRDEILKNSDIIFDAATDLDTAIACAEKNITQITDIANKVIENNGKDYSATAYIGNAYFETREYDDFTLPAGEYISLIVNLGQGEGKNWWCVVYPAVCLPAAKGELSESVGTKGVYVAEHPQKYVIRFKIIEWYESLRDRWKK